MSKQTAQSTLTLVNTIVESIQEKKGRNILSLNISKLENTICDYFIICEAGSTTQVAAIADFIDYNVGQKINDFPLHIEGKSTARWVLLDYGDVVVHIFLDEMRSFYNLEALWADGKFKHIPSEV